MEPFRHPVGRLPAAVYWRRRAVVIAVPLVLIGLIAYGCVALTSSPAAHHTNAGGAGHSPSPKPAQPTGPITASPGPSGPTVPGIGEPLPNAPTTGTSSGGTSVGSGTTTGSGSGSSSGGATGATGGNVLSGNANCALSIQLTTNQLTYASGSDPRFTVTVANVGSDECTIDVSKRGLALTVRQNNERVWSSGDCPARITTDDRQLSPGDTYTETLTWPRQHSAQGCVPNQPAAGPGSYTATASVAGVSSGTVNFQLA